MLKQDQKNSRAENACDLDCRDPYSGSTSVNKNVVTFLHLAVFDECLIR